MGLLSSLPILSRTLTHLSPACLGHASLAMYAIRPLRPPGMQADALAIQHLVSVSRTCQRVYSSSYRPRLTHPRWASRHSVYSRYQIQEFRKSETSLDKGFSQRKYATCNLHPVKHHRTHLNSYQKTWFDLTWCESVGLIARWASSSLDLLVSLWFCKCGQKLALTWI